MKTATSKSGLYQGFSCDDSGVIDPSGLIDTAFIDGYRFGDRLLEQVPFTCHVLSDGALQVSTHPSAADYMADLNEEKWLQAALEYAENADDFTVQPSGQPSGDEECFLVLRNPSEVPVSKPEPRQISMMSASNWLRRLGGKVHGN